MGLLSLVRDALARLCARRYHTMFGTAKVYDVSWEDTRIRVLDVEHTLQSATYLDERWCDVPFPYLALYDAVFATAHPAQNICMLGGGGYAFPKHVIAEHPEARIDVVEIDPAITRIAREQFFLDRLVTTYGTEESGRLRIFTTDAITHLGQCAHNHVRYDAIVNDCFQVDAPEESLTHAQGIDLVHTCLADEGLYLTNIIAALEGDDAEPLRSLVALLSSRFAHVCALPCERSAPDIPDNIVVVASDADPKLGNALRLFDAQ